MVVISVSTIGFVTVLTVSFLFLPLGCNCFYGVVSVSTIGFVTVLTCGLCFYDYRRNSYNPMVETETTP
jgi:hypothetical protein